MLYIFIVQTFYPFTSHLEDCHIEAVVYDNKISRQTVQSERTLRRSNIVLIVGDE